ncbi:Presenilin-domain-containing protein [Helicostylum pulchrum]|nr:Presenilin-domain-containing protein [Helicostylum pulchrum]
MSLHEENQVEEPLLPSEFIESNSPESRQEEKRKEAIQFYVDQLTLLFYPLILTFSLVCWIEITLNIDNSLISNPLMFYDELASDSTGVRLGGSVLNAIIVVCGITAMTFLFVLCFKYRLYKFIFFWLGLSVLSILGVTTTTLWLEMMSVYRIPLDYITMAVCAWNFSIVGVIAIFWNSPLWLQQGYLIIVSTATSISMLRMPPWTTWTVLIAVSIYDLFAVLCPSGPLRLLISMAEERQENIPALIYSAGMASIDADENNPIGGYRTQESNSSKKIDWSAWLPFSSKSKGYTTLENEEDEAGSSNLSTNELQNFADCRPVQRRNSEEEEEDDDEDEDMNAIKLGLGDFIFYSVLVGKASRTDPITLCLCIVAILTGLSLTIFILTLNRTALPALPISILFGAVTYAIGYFMTSNMIGSLSMQAIQL